MITLPYEYIGITGKKYTILGWTDFLKDRLRVKDDNGRIWDVAVVHTKILLERLNLKKEDIPHEMPPRS